MKKMEFMEQAGELFEGLRQWRAEHREASFDEIADEVTGRRQKLMGVLLKELAEQCGQGELLTEGQCASCGGKLHYKGKKKREVVHPEGTAGLERGYHHCEPCGHGVFPLDEELGLGEQSWSPGTVSKLLQVGVEVPSYERGAALFCALTHVPLSKSSLHRLVNQYGKVVGEKLEEEASAMVRVPSKDEPVVWRTLPEPDSPIMNVSSDGVLIHIIDEGWKEVKIAAVSAVTATVEEESGTQQISLTQHS